MQHGFRTGRFCIDAVFIVKQVADKDKAIKILLILGTIPVEPSRERNIIT